MVQADQADLLDQVDLWEDLQKDFQEDFQEDQVAQDDQAVEDFHNHLQGII